MFCSIYKTKIGSFYIEEENNFITKIILLNKSSYKCMDYPMIESPLTKKAFYELEQYFQKKRVFFDLPLNPQGTSFQKKVWNALCNIPYGETRSYQDIAIAIGSPKAARAIGLANHHNPILIMIPCHRVIGKNGKLVGFGCGLDVKETLLNLEKK